MTRVDLENDRKVHKTFTETENNHRLTLTGFVELAWIAKQEHLRRTKSV
jgi:hypothetical protein